MNDPLLHFTRNQNYHDTNRHWLTVSEYIVNQKLIHLQYTAQCCIHATPSRNLVFWKPLFTGILSSETISACLSTYNSDSYIISAVWKFKNNTLLLLQRANGLVRTQSVRPPKKYNYHKYAFPGAYNIYYTRLYHLEGERAITPT